MQVLNDIDHKNKLAANVCKKPMFSLNKKQRKFKKNKKKLKLLTLIVHYLKNIRKN